VSKKNKVKSVKCVICQVIWPDDMVKYGTCESCLKEHTPTDPIEMKPQGEGWVHADNAPIVVRPRMRGEGSFGGMIMNSWEYQWVEPDRSVFDNIPLPEQPGGFEFEPSPDVDWDAIRAAQERMERAMIEAITRQIESTYNEMSGQRSTFLGGLQTLAEDPSPTNINMMIDLLQESDIVGSTVEWLAWARDLGKRPATLQDAAGRTVGFGWLQIESGAVTLLRHGLPATFGEAILFKGLSKDRDIIGGKWVECESKAEAWLVFIEAARVVPYRPI
jgi:hypothetical protein